MRLDKWLWQARFARTRAAAGEMIGNGRVRVNGRVVSKLAQPVGAGDTLTVVQGQVVRVVTILALPLRRGPASEAASLYRELPDR